MPTMDELFFTLAGGSKIDIIKQHEENLRSVSNMGCIKCQFLQDSRTQLLQALRSFNSSCCHKQYNSEIFDGCYNCLNFGASDLPHSDGK